MISRPPRIVDDPTVDARIRTHVQRAQDARVAGSLAPQLARLLVAVQEEPPPESSARRRWLASGIAVPGLACLLFGIVAGVSTSTNNRPSAPAEPPREEAVAATAPAPPAVPAPSQGETESPASLSQEPVVDTLSIHDLPAARPHPIPSKAGGGSGGASTLEDEIAQLAEVRTLAQSDPARALSAAEAGHRRFRASVLYQEREAIAIDALKRLHRLDEAQKRAKRFTQSYPDSPFAKRVVAGIDGL